MVTTIDELALFNRGPVVLFKWRNDEGWPVAWTSANVKQLTGHTAEDFISGAVSYAKCVHADDLERVGVEVEKALDEEVEAFEHEPYRIVHADGSERWLHDVTHMLRTGGKVTHFVGYVVDITGRIESAQRAAELEKQLLHAQKLESLGVLAGGVAHDFNNLLTGILGEASLARLELDSPGGDPHSSIEQIEQLGRRAAELTRQLLAYSGKGRFVNQALDLSELVRENIVMLGVVISKKAALKSHLAEDLPAISADRSQMQQIIMNLITNASDALGEAGGVINIKTSTEVRSSESLQGLFGAKDLQAGTYVALEVSDNGCGMPQKVRERLFDPFFTTKAMGRGLGMSAILGIVRAHQGVIRVYSEPGQGTAFKVLFPSIDEVAVAIEHGESVSRWQGTGTALIVDDEPSVRSVAARMLGRLGFKTRVAADGREAVQLFKAHRAEIVVVLLDMMMPKMGGKETLSALRAISPTLPVVMSSGFNEQEAISRLSARGMTSFLQKPYELPDVETAVRKAIG